jgi:hypothetical protein
VAGQELPHCFSQAVQRQEYSGDIDEAMPRHCYTYFLGAGVSFSAGAAPSFAGEASSLADPIPRVLAIWQPDRIRTNEDMMSVISFMTCDLSGGG